MLKEANGKSASIFPPGIMDRIEYQRMRADEVASLKEEIKSGLEESRQVSADGCDLYAVTLEHNACIAMHRLIEMGAL